MSGLEFGRGTDYDRAFGRRRQPRQLEQIDSGGERTSVHASIDAFWLWREGAERPKMMSSGLDLRIIGRPRGWPGWSGC